MVFSTIQSINLYSETKIYQIIFWTIIIGLSLLSFTLQTIHDKLCNFFGEIVRIFHHFAVFLIYFGWAAPSNWLYIMLLFSMSALLSWVIMKNKCVLNIIEKQICHTKFKRFHDLIYYFPIFNLDKQNIKYRIPLICIMNVIIFMRLYVYNQNTTPKTNFEIHGHRGARGHYPENSIYAFDYALNNDVNALELDLHMTKDKQLIINHNSSIDTKLCINGPSVPLKDLTLSEIKQYNCSIQNEKFPLQKKIDDVRLITLNELLEYIKLSNSQYKDTIKFNIEIKTEDKIDSENEVYEFAVELINILHKNNISNRTIIQSFDQRAIIIVKKIDPSIKLSFLIEDPKINMIEIGKKLNVDIISPDYTFLNKDIVNQLHDNNILVLPWTVDTTTDLQKMININVDGVITDYPKEMIDYIHKLNGLHHNW